VSLARGLPTVEGLPQTHILFYDAIAHSLETIERGYRTLEETLTKYVLDEDMAPGSRSSLDRPLRRAPLPRVLAR
jgi:hypothetical protein